MTKHGAAAAALPDRRRRDCGRGGAASRRRGRTTICWRRRARAWRPQPAIRGPRARSPCSPGWRRTSTRARWRRRSGAARARARIRWSRRRRPGCWRACSSSAARRARRRRCGRRWVCSRTSLVIGPFGEGRASFATTLPARGGARARPRSARSYPGKARDVGLALGRRGGAGRRAVPGRPHPSGDQNAVAYVAAVRAQRSRSRGGAAPRVARADQGLGQRRARVPARRGPPRGARSGRGRRAARPRLEPDPDQDRGHAKGRGGSTRASPSRRGAPLQLGRQVAVAAARRTGRGASAAKVPGVASLAQLLERAWPATRRAGGGVAGPGALARLEHAARQRRARGVLRRSSGRCARRRPVPARLGAADAAADDDEARRVLEHGAGAASRRAHVAGAGARAAGRGRARRARATRARWRCGARRWRSIPPAGWRRWRSPRRRRTRGCRWRGWRGWRRCRRTSRRCRASARGRAPVRRGRQEPRPTGCWWRWRGERRRDVELLHQLSVARPPPRRRRRRRGRGWRRRRRCVPTCRRWRSSSPGCSRATGDRLARARDADRGWSTGCPTSRRRWWRWASCCTGWAARPTALERLRTALALRPQDPELKRYVDRLARRRRASDSGVADELARRFAEDARALLPPAGKPRQPTRSGSGAVVLLDRRVVRVHRNGLSRTFAQRVVQVLTERGAEENKEFGVHYTPGPRGGRHPAGARLPARRARRARRCWRRPIAATRICRSPGTASTTTTAPRSCASRGCGRATCVEIQYLVDDVGSDNQMADYFGDLQYIAENIPKRRWDYTLIAPASRAHPRQRPASCRGCSGR